MAQIEQVSSPESETKTLSRELVARATERVLWVAHLSMIAGAPQAQEGGESREGEDAEVLLKAIQFGRSIV